MQVPGSIFRNDMITIARMHRIISIPMKNDGRDTGSIRQDRRSAGPGRQFAVSHCGERRTAPQARPECTPIAA
jgi:hypothetical protein